MQDFLSSSGFQYDEAFSRNIGWVTKEEQERLRQATAAIAGVGGVGGAYLLTLARLGVENFKIADFDQFEAANINRQVGASIDTIGQQKVNVMANMVTSINPRIKVDCFPMGINQENIETFLKGCDIFLDGIDFFALNARQLSFQYCHELNIPAITAAPLGMGAAYLIFMPNHMSFKEYFCLNANAEEENYLRFLSGLSPSSTHSEYLVDKSKIDLKNRKGPSTFMACQLCAGIVGTQALKIILQRGPIYPAPYYHLFDAFMHKHICEKI